MNLKINGNTRLVGEVNPSGSVFSAITLVSASLLFGGEVSLENVPQVPALVKFLSNLKNLGTTYSWVSRNSLTIVTPTLNNTEIADPILIPILLSRSGEFKIPKNLFPRPLIEWLNDIGIDITTTNEEVIGTLGSLKGLNLNLENSLEKSLAALILACKIPEASSFTNFLMTEETLDLLAFLRGAGINIIEDQKLAGSLKIIGQATLDRTDFILPASSLESAFWVGAAILSFGDLKINDAPKERLISLLSKLTALGVTFDFSGDNLRVWHDLSQKLLPLDIEINKTQIIYDFLPILIPILLAASGASMITGLDLTKEPEIADLNLFNAKIFGSAITGPASLKGAKVLVPDFTSGLSLLLAALGSGSRSELLEAEKILDYFDNFEVKLKSMSGS